MTQRASALPWVRRLARAESGIAITEFGLIAPVFFLMLIGLYDITHMAYARSVFNGAVERAARAAALEGGDPAAVDEMVRRLINPVMPGVEVETTRSSYFDFADIGRPEQFTDGNGNDTCDNDEAYIDENGSGTWEEDIGEAGNGGASDVVVYTVTASYEPLFKVPFMSKAWNTRTITASTIKKNQPFGDQLGYAVIAGTCSDE